MTKEQTNAIGIVLFLAEAGKDAMQDNGVWDAWIESSGEDWDDIYDAIMLVRNLI